MCPPYAGTGGRLGQQSGKSLKPVQLLPSEVGVQRIPSLAVRDEGSGLSADDQAKLFGKFSRLSARPTGGERSTGLGLSIVKRLVQEMAGSMEIASTVGEGTTFVVEFPSPPREG